jgi:putative nucleotidyltransferase with HDIG domain
MPIVKIDKTQLTIGMFVEAVEGIWSADRSIGRRFKVEDQAQLQAIQNSNVSGVFINTELGNQLSPVAVVRRSSAPARYKTSPRARLQEMKWDLQRNVSLATRLMDDIQMGHQTSPASFAPMVEDIAKTMQENPSLYLGMTRLRTQDTATYTHSLAVAALLWNFSISLGLEQHVSELVCIGGLLHDIGKLSIPPAILQKQDPLDPHERLIMESHSEKGAQLLSGMEALPPVLADICRHHHERLDGNGYPDRLSDTSIGLYVRMTTICDVFDALTSSRPYKRGWSSQEALKWMLTCEGQFDKSLLWKFVLSLEPQLTRGIL